jgi:hypothetical protein
VDSPFRIKRLNGSGSSVMVSMVVENVADRWVTLVARRGTLVRPANLYQSYVVADANSDASRPPVSGVLGVQAAAAADFEPSRDEYHWDFKPHQTRTIHVNALCVNFEKNPLPRAYTGNFSITRDDRFNRLFDAVDRANVILSDPVQASEDVRVSKILETASRINGTITVSPSTYNVAIWMSQGVSRERIFDRLVRPRLHGGVLDEERIAAANSDFDAAEELLNLQ